MAQAPTSSPSEELSTAASPLRPELPDEMMLGDEDMLPYHQDSNLPWARRQMRRKYWAVVRLPLGSLVCLRDRRAYRRYLETGEGAVGWIHEAARLPARPPWPRSGRTTEATSKIPVNWPGQ